MTTPNTVTEPRIHYAWPYHPTISLCNVKPNATRYTPNLIEVTCGLCRNTLYYRRYAP